MPGVIRKADEYGSAHREKQARRASPESVNIMLSNIKANKERALVGKPSPGK